MDDDLNLRCSHLVPAVRAHPEAALEAQIAVDTCGAVRASEMQELRALYLSQQEQIQRLKDRLTQVEQELKRK